ncbi:MAG: hypothetical protein LBG59_06905 [Candidatus Peribacteria bacterium]|jgi:hypothetical protein|nr:hypothetical protein [Candidatus Peribacteria bacterium]
MYKCICNKIFAGEKPIGVFKQLTEGKEYEIEKEEIVKFPKKVNKKT